MAKLYPDYNNKFINPYNFVPLTSQVERKQSENDANEKTLNGYISCSLKVIDMLALPDRSAEDKARPRCYDFYKIDGKPVIPGSEIRGCIRAVYEALTQSCLSVINNNVLTGRLPSLQNDIKPGVLRYENDKWVIYEAVKLNQAQRDKTTEKPLLEREWIKSGNDPKPKFKKTYFYIHANKPVYSCNTRDIEDFNALLDIFIDNNSDNNKFCSILKGMKKAIVIKSDIPVFFRLKNGNLNYFSPAQISRQMFKNTVSELLGPHSNSCGQENGYCPACRLFGTLGNNKSTLFPLASRVRFSDAVANENVVIHDSYINLPELSSPKITSVEFYSFLGVEQRNAKQWNYDDYGVSLNGRKFYYHSKPQNDKELGERSLATKPACASDNGKFSFKVYFDKVSLSELKKLLWVLTVGENDPQSRMMHKLGYGRPVGYGSVKITIDKVVERSIENGAYILSDKSFDDYEVTDSVFAEKKALGSFKLIANYDYVSGKTVAYPIADDGQNDKNSTASHNWFSNNRQGKLFKYVLPKLTENPDDLLLPAMVANPTNQNGNDMPSGKTYVKHNKPKNFDFSKFVEGREYKATVTDIYEKGNDVFVWVEVQGEKASIKLKPDFFKKINLKNSNVIKVLYKGRNKTNPIFPCFWVK